MIKVFISAVLLCFIQICHANKTLNVTYTSYNYKMTSKQFNKFLDTNKLNKPLLSNNDGIIYQDKIKSLTLAKISKNSALIFSKINNGGSSCIANKDSCQFINTDQSDKNTISSYLKIAPLYATDKSILINVTGSYKNQSDKLILNFTTSFSKALNNNYIIITQRFINKNLYGQIILISLY